MIKNKMERRVTNPRKTKKIVRNKDNKPNKMQIKNRRKVKSRLR